MEQQPVKISEVVNQQLEELSTSTKHSFSFEAFDEEFILTQEEQDAAIKNAIEREKEHVSWKMNQLKYSKIQIMERMRDIDWEEKIDRKEILKRSNSLKHQQLWVEQNRIREREEERKRLEDLKTTWTSEFLFNYMKSVCEQKYKKRLVCTAKNKKYIRVLCMFICRDKRLETEFGYSLNKGLLIRGVSGIGKTFLPKLLEDNKLNPILILSILDITDSLKESGDYEIKMDDKKIVYFDDVGAEEPKIKYYGTVISYFETFIQKVYLKKTVFNDIIISTNNSFDEIEQKYGFRVRSRMKDMFNVIDVEGEDMRG